MSEIYEAETIWVRATALSKPEKDALRLSVLIVTLPAIGVSHDNLANYLSQGLEAEALNTQPSWHVAKRACRAEPAATVAR